MFDARARAVILSMALLLSGTGFMVQPTSATSFNNVQIFADSISTKAGNFQFAAYNLTGALVASSQTLFSAAAFELPSGTYLFTATASDYTYPYQYACSLATQTTPPIKSVPPSSTVIPWCRPPSSEYGYAVNSITGPQAINIVLQNASTLPTTQVTVKASYTNGTAVAGAYVYASVVGEWYYWGWYNDVSLNMSSQTDSNGMVHLIIPVAPVVVTAWKWMPVYVEANTTSEVNVGGQKVNITAYWEPTYVGLSGSGLVIPPQNNIAITLSYQQPDYWVMPEGVAPQSAYVNGSPTATEASQPNGTPSLVSNSAQSSSQGYLPAKIPALQVTGAQPAGTQAGPGADVVVISALAFIAVAIGVVLAARRRAKPPIR